MMKKSFTLIEILIAVSIFIVVSVITVAIMTMSISTKSKVLANNDLRVEGSKIMAEIQDMVEKGNWGTNYVQPTNDSGALDNIAYPPCTNISGVHGLYSHFIDSRGWHLKRYLLFSDSTIKENRKIYTGNDTFPDDYIQILPSNITVSNLTIDGLFRGSGVCPYSTKVTINLTLNDQTRGFTGQATTLKLKSTFVPKYPGPDKAGDSY